MAQVKLGFDYGPEWERAQRALVYARKTANERFAVTQKRVTEQAIAKVREEALRLPAHGKKHRGTRALIARGIQSKRTRRGRRIVTEMPRGMEMLPRGFESQWHHPVFGRGMVIQAPQTDWFIDPIAHFHHPLKSALEQDLQNMAQDIDRMSGGR